MTTITSRATPLFAIFIATLFSCSAQEKIKTVDSVYKDVNGVVYLKKIFNKDQLLSQWWVMKDTIISVALNPTDPPVLDIENDVTKWKRFVQNNLEWPTNIDIEGRVIVCALINDSGKIVDKRVIKSIPKCMQCNISALKFIDKLPLLKPATLEGKPVYSVKYILIPFRNW